MSGALTQARVKELFDYLDGNLVWRISKSAKIRAGDVAGCFGNGYIHIRVDGKQYKAHRLIWLWHNGYMPENDIDHRNRRRWDNHIDNLREASDVCNQRNTSNRSTNKSGVKGVCWHSALGKWHANIMVEGKQCHLGYHKDLIEAVCHRLAAEQALDWNGCDDCSQAFQYLKKETSYGR